MSFKTIIHRIEFNDAYNRIVNQKEELVPRWINAPDIETDFIEKW